MKTISIAVVLFLLALVVIYAVVNKHDISIETPFASVTSTAPKVITQAAESAKHSVEQSSPASIKSVPKTGSSEALPATFLLTKLTSIRPQEPRGEDSIYLKFGDSTTEVVKLKAGESVLMNRVVEAGTTVSLWERDGLMKDGDDDFLGKATPQGPDGKLRFEQLETGDHLYTLSYEPES